MEYITEVDTMSLCNTEHSKDPTSWESLPSSPTSPHFFEFPILTTTIHTTIPFPSNDTVVSSCANDTCPSVTPAVNQKRSALVKLPENVKHPYRSHSSGKRSKVVVGVVKFQPEMELSEIKRRQARIGPPVLTLPPVGHGEREIVGVKRTSSRDKWALLRPCSRFGRLLTKLLVQTKTTFPCIGLHT